MNPLVKPRYSTIVILLLCFVALWIGLYFTVPENSGYKLSSASAKGLDGWFVQMPFLAVIISLLLTLLNAGLIFLMNNRFTIIRVRTFVPVFVFMMLMTAWHHLHYSVCGHFALTVLIISGFVCFNIYREKNAPEEAFMGTLVLAVGSLLVAPLVLFIPIMWVNFIRYNCFSFRNFAASLIGLLLPYIFYCGIKYLFLPDLQWFADIIEAFRPDILFFNRPYVELAYIALMALLYVLGHISMLSAVRQDSIQIRAKLDIIFLFGITAFAFAVCFAGQYQIFMPFVAFAFAILFSHPLTTKNSKFNRVLFIAFVVLNLVYLGAKVYLEF